MSADLEKRVKVLERHDSDWWQVIGFVTLAVIAFDALIHQPKYYPEVGWVCSLHDAAWPWEAQESDVFTCFDNARMVPRSDIVPERTATK